MAYLAPPEFVTKMVDAGESKLVMSTRDTLIRSYMAGAILSPILVTLAVTTNMIPTRLVLPFVFTLALCYMLPNSSARMTLVAVSGAVDTRTQLRSGLVVGLPSALFVFLFFALLSAAGLI